MLKFKIKYYLLKKDYQSLKILLFKQEKAVSYLDDDEKELLLDYAITHQEFILFSIILESMEYSSKLNNLIDKYLESAKCHLAFLYAIACITCKNQDKYAEQITKIKEIIKDYPVTEIVACIYSLNGFSCDEAYKRVLESSNPRFIYYLIENKSKEEIKKVLEQFMFMNPSPEKVYRLASILYKENQIQKNYTSSLQYNPLKILEEIIMNLEISKSTKGKYLIALLDGTNNYYLIEKIIELADIEQTRRLIHKLREDAPSIIRKYQDSSNINILVTLACATNIKETEIFIKKVLAKCERNLTLTLIMYVYSSYLPMIFKEVLKSEEDTLHLINDLYLYGSNRWIDVINYIKENNLELLSCEINNKITNFLEDKNQVIRKRNLTL